MPRCECCRLDPGEQHAELPVVLCPDCTEGFEKERRYNGSPIKHRGRRIPEPLDPVGIALLACWFPRRIADRLIAYAREQL